MYHQEYAAKLKEIVDENKNRELLELRQKYNYERLQNDNTRLQLGQQKIYTSFSILLLIIALPAFIFYKKMTDNKKKVLKQENQILETEKEIYQLMEKLNRFGGDPEYFQNLLRRNFAVLKKVFFEQQLKKKDEQTQRLVKKFNMLVYEQETMNWEIFYDTMNRLYQQLFDRLKTKYSDLSESEFRICCLTCADFSITEIGIVMGLSPNTVEMKRSDIRKKLGIEPRGKIQPYLKKLLES